MKIENLSIGYRTEKGAAALASPICLTAERGEFIALLGANGCGKSTLLRTLAGLQPPLAGRVSMDGEDIQRLSPRQRARLVSVVLTHREAGGNLTAAQVAAQGRAPHTGFFGKLSADDKALVDQALQTVGMAELANRPFHQLSDGERQKVLIARALAQQTPTVLLDEPTAFLDYPSKCQCMEILRRMAHEENRLVLLSTHDVHLAMRFADRIWYMQRGSELIACLPSETARFAQIEQFIAPEQAENQKF